MTKLKYIEPFPFTQRNPKALVLSCISDERHYILRGVSFASNSVVLEDRETGEVGTIYPVKFPDELHDIYCDLGYPAEYEKCVGTPVSIEYCPAAEEMGGAFHGLRIIGPAWHVLISVGTIYRHSEKGEEAFTYFNVHSSGQLLFPGVISTCEL